jgi:hypothetical protein
MERTGFYQRVYADFRRVEMIYGVRGRLGVTSTERIEPVKLRNLLLIALGIFIGVRVTKAMREDDPNVVHGPQGERADNPAAKIIGAQAQRLAGQAAVLSLDAIRRARGAIRTRLGEEDENAAWS